MSSVRRFVDEDIPQVADLHRRVFGTGEATSPGWMDSYRRYFSNVFLNTSVGGGNGALGSLVYECRGRILGFLGVMPRRMAFKGKAVQMVVCSQFAVDPGERGQIGLQILKRCLAGPQDLSLTDEAGDNTRRIWEWCGGTTVLHDSVNWIRPLRPAQALMALAARRGSCPSCIQASAPIARMLDAVLIRLAPRAFRLARPRGSREELDDATLVTCLSEFAAGRSLGPDDDPRPVIWAVERAGQRADHARLRRVLVRDDAGAINGWFVYSLSRDRIGEVLQMAARPYATRQVLEHLLDDAAQYGGVAVSGRLEPAFAPDFSENRCLLYRRERWTLIHSKNPELSYTIQRGDAFLTRLEGEWCLRYP